jgi:hypothetical protein
MGSELEKHVMVETNASAGPHRDHHGSTSSNGMGRRNSQVHRSLQSRERTRHHGHVK